MIGGLLKSTSRLAVIAAAGLLIGGAANAGGSIGGDCCADLEERVAELEATTARKGNRKVSLTVYGHVNKAVLFSEDMDPAKTDADDVAIIDNTISGSRFGLRGEARISSDLYAGYKLEFQVSGGDPLEDAQDSFSPFGATLKLRHNDLYIASKTFGRLSIGQGSTASDSIAEIDLSGTAGVAGGSSDFAGEITTGHNFDNLDGMSRRERVRYDTPTLAGFRLSASWQEDDSVDVALRFGSSLGDFTVAAGVAYFEDNSGAPAEHYEAVAGSASVFHVPTGLNLTFAGGDKDFDDPASDDFDYWYLKGGVKRKIFGAGATAFSVDYHQAEYDSGMEADKIGFQLVQNIDAAAMELYVLGWSTETNQPAGAGEEDALMIGSRIQF